MGDRQEGRFHLLLEVEADKTPMTLISNKNTKIDNGFGGKFCKKHQCQPEDFEKKVLLRCLYVFASPAAWLIWPVSQNFFQEDLDLINELKDITSFGQVRDIVSFYSIQPRKKNLLRQWLNIRMSKAKLLKLARSILRESDKE